MKKQTLALLSLFLGFGLLTSCQGEQTSSPDDSSHSPSTPASPSSPSEPSSSLPDSSSPSSSTTSPEPEPEPWTPGSEALENADQPENAPSALLGPLNELRKSEGRQVLPSIGNLNLLVVPIEFSDDATTDFDDTFVFAEGMTEMADDLFFGTDSSANLPSVKDFYEESSLGSLLLDGVVSPIITIDESLTSAATTIQNQGVNAYLANLASTIYDYLFVEETRTYDPAMFDGDGNGQIDGLILLNPLFPSLFIDYGDDSYNAAATDYVLFSDSYSAPIDSLGYTSIYDAILPAYMLQMAGISYYSDPDSHFFINTVGSMLGLENYYDNTGNSTTGTYRSPLAMTDRMDGYIGDHNPFSKYQLGWIEPTSVFTPENIGEGMTVTLSKDEPLLLSYDEFGLYGEYLLVDFYSPTGLDEADSVYPYIYGRSTFSVPGVRVYEVNSTLVREENGTYLPYSGNPDYDATYTASDGTEKNYGYYYRHSNESINPLADYGIIDFEPLLSLLSKKGSNRHITDMNVALGNDDLFLEGDSFGEGLVPGFYSDFAFDSGTKLGLTFTVDAVDDSSATITIKRA